MKYSCIIALSFFVLVSGSVCAQEKDNNIPSDSLHQCRDFSAEKGDLRALVQKIHETFLIYTTGSPIIRPAYPLPIGGKRKDAADVKRIVIKPDGPIILDVTDDERGKLLWLDNPKLDVPIDEIKSIEISYDKLWNSAIYGSRGSETCIIKIKFKEP